MRMIEFFSENRKLAIFLLINIGILILAGYKLYSYYKTHDLPEILRRTETETSIQIKNTPMYKKYKIATRVCTIATCVPIILMIVIGREYKNNWIRHLPIGVFVISFLCLRLLPCWLFWRCPHCGKVLPCHTTHGRVRRYVPNMVTECENCHKSILND